MYMERGGGGGGSSDEYTRKYMYPATKQHRLRKLILVKEVKEGPNGHPLNTNKLRWGESQTQLGFLRFY